MTLFQKQRDCYPVTENGILIGYISRTFNNEIYVQLLCKYSQRFWVDITDLEAIKRCEEMKKAKILTS